MWRIDYVLFAQSRRFRTFAIFGHSFRNIHVQIVMHEGKKSIFIEYVFILHDIYGSLNAYIYVHVLHILHTYHTYLHNAKCIIPTYLAKFGSSGQQLIMNWIKGLLHHHLPVPVPVVISPLWHPSFLPSPIPNQPEIKFVAVPPPSPPSSVAIWPFSDK
jgi:hypothetical protein